MSPSIEWPLLASVVLAGETLGLVWLVLTRRVLLPLSTELGLACIAIGLCLAAVSLWDGGGCSGAERAARLLFIAVGTLVLMVSMMVKRPHGSKPPPARNGEGNA